MKSIVVFTSLILCCLLAAGCSDNISSDSLSEASVADENSLTRDAHDHHRTVLFDALGLSEAQVKAIHEARRTRFESGRRDQHFEKGGEDRIVWHEQRREEMRQLLKSNLNETQLAILAEIEADQAAGRVPARLIDARIDRLDAVLNLTEEQKTGIREILARSGAEMITLRKSVAEKEDGFAEHREQMHEKYSGARQQISELLTEDQRQLFEQVKARRDEHRRGEHHRGGHGKDHK